MIKGRSSSASTARKLLGLLLLMMRGIAAEMRRGREHLSPAHLGLLAKIESGPCGLTELARHQVVRLPTISKSVGLLVRHGWVMRSMPDSNRRQTIVRLTPTGRQVLARLRRRSERHIASLLDSLSAAERAQLNAGLHVLEPRWQSHENRSAGNPPLPGRRLMRRQRHGGKTRR